VSAGEAWATAFDQNMGISQQADLRSGIERFRVLPVDGEIAFQWARIASIANELGHNLTSGSSEDLWIAATAVATRIPLMTESAELFADFPGLKVEACVQP
jgi:predicted nucleic acid-binding protein